MTEVFHPISLWGTGAPFWVDGKRREHAMAPVLGPGQSSLRDVNRFNPGSLVCAHSYESFDGPTFSAPRRVWTVVECVEKNWGEHPASKTPAISYDLVLVEHEEAICPLCTVREVMYT